VSTLGVVTFNLCCGHAPDGPDARVHRRESVVGSIRDADPDARGARACIPRQDRRLRDMLPAIDAQASPRGGPRVYRDSPPRSGAVRSSRSMTA